MQFNIPTTGRQSTSCSGGEIKETETETVEYDKNGLVTKRVVSRTKYSDGCPCHRTHMKWPPYGDSGGIVTGGTQPLTTNA